MCNVSTREDPHTPDTHPTLQNPYYLQDTTFRNGGHGPHHWSTTERHPRFDPHHCRPWLLSCRYLPSLLFYGHRSESCPIISRQRLQMVRPTQQNDLGPRPSIHVSLRQSTGG